MIDQAAKFDGLAEDYDKTRPRYPRSIFDPVQKLCSEDKPLKVADVGAGTGIILETLYPMIPLNSTVYCVDVSSDMVNIGQKKIPGS